MAATLISIWLLHLAALASPGANVLLVSQMAASGRRDSARFAGLGVVVGAGLWAVSAVLGVHAVFQAFPVLRLSLQVVGGLYLLYVAIRAWRSEPGAWSEGALAVTPLQAFRLGLLTNVTNPKAALFYSSVFAASFPPEPTPALQSAAVAVVVANALCWYMVLAYLFSRQSIRNAYAGARKTASRVTAVCFGAFGIGLLVSTYRASRA